MVVLDLLDLTPVRAVGDVGGLPGRLAADPPYEWWRLHDSLRDRTEAHATDAHGAQERKLMITTGHTCGVREYRWAHGHE